MGIITRVSCIGVLTGDRQCTYIIVKPLLYTFKQDKNDKDSYITMVSKTQKGH